MKSFKTQAHIHTLDGQMDEITVLEELGNSLGRTRKQQLFSGLSRGEMLRDF